MINKVEITSQERYDQIIKTWEDLKSGKSTISILDDGKGYRNRLMEAFKKLMSTPRGRKLVVDVAASRFPTNISHQAAGPAAIQENPDEASPKVSRIPGDYGMHPGKGSAGTIYMGPDIKDDTIKILGPDNKIANAPIFTILAHELAHVDEFHTGMAVGEYTVIEVTNEIRKEHGIDIRIDHRRCDTRKGKKCLKIEEFHEGD